MKNRSIVFYIIFLTVYAYEFSKSQQIATVYDNYITTSQYARVICIGAGFLLFYLSRRLFDSIMARKLILMVFNVIFVVSMLVMLNIPEINHISCIMGISLGYLGGMVYYYIAAAIGRTEYVGRVAMVSQSLSVLIQMILPGNFDDSGLAIIALIIGFCAVTYLLIRPPADWMFEEMLPYAKDDEAWNHEINIRIRNLIIIVVFADIFGCLVEVSWTMLQETGNVDMYSFPRFFMIAGYVAAGIFSDYKKHKYIDNVLLVTLGISFSGMYMADCATARLSVFYFMAGFIILYMNIKFWNLAPYTHKPEIWASFGRILYVFEGFICEIAIKVLKGRAFYTTMTMGCLFAVIVYFVLKEASYKPLGEWIGFSDENGGNDVSEENGKASIQGSAYKEQRNLVAFILEYQLTPREGDVIKCLLESDESMKIIAGELEISERMLYRYMKQIYEKTGTENRTGLVKSYYEYIKED